MEHSLGFIFLPGGESQMTFSFQSAALQSWPRALPDIHMATGQGDGSPRATPCSLSSSIHPFPPILSSSSSCFLASVFSSFLSGPYLVQIFPLFSLLFILFLHFFIHSIFPSILSLPLAFPLFSILSFNSSFLHSFHLSILSLPQAFPLFSILSF